jgi:hypothetical protein
VIEHLADGLTDWVQLAAAARAGPVLNIEPSVLTWQVRRQAWPFVTRLRSSGPGWRKPGFGPRQIGVEVLEGEL